MNSTTKTNAHDLIAYKRAKIIIKEISEISDILRITYRQLVKYKKYTPIKEILSDMLHAEAVLKMVSDKQQDVVKTKGKMNE